MVSNPLKQCSVCKIYKPFSEFYNNKDSKDGKSYRCKACDNEARAKYHKTHENRSKLFNYFRLIKHRYNLSAEDYLYLLAQQDGKCRICGRKVTGNNNYHLAIDHNHETGEVRGLLCNRCNRALGLFQDNPEILRKAATYLEERGNYDTH